MRRQGFTEWEKPKAAHEAGVCFVYAYAAVCGLQAMSGRYVAMGKLPEIGGSPSGTRRSQSGYRYARTAARNGE